MAAVKGGSPISTSGRGIPTGGFVMLGKTFKGLTDQMLSWQTETLLGLATEQGEYVVRVRPELVVEVAFDGVQASSRYPGGVALRFARVKGYRPDKDAAEEADTIETVRALHQRRAIDQESSSFSTRRAAMDSPTRPITNSTSTWTAIDQSKIPRVRARINSTP